MGDVSANQAPDESDALGARTDSDLGAERGPQPHRDTSGTVGGGTESDRPGAGTSATPGTSGGGDHERMEESDE